MAFFALNQLLHSVCLCRLLFQGDIPTPIERSISEFYGGKADRARLSVQAACSVFSTLPTAMGCC